MRSLVVVVLVVMALNQCRSFAIDAITIMPETLDQKELRFAVTVPSTGKAKTSNRYAIDIEPKGMTQECFRVSVSLSILGVVLVQYGEFDALTNQGFRFAINDQYVTNASFDVWTYSKYAVNYGKGPSKHYDIPLELFRRTVGGAVGPLLTNAPTRGASNSLPQAGPSGSNLETRNR